MLPRTQFMFQFIMLQGQTIIDNSIHCIFDIAHSSAITKSTTCGICIHRNQSLFLFETMRLTSNVSCKFIHGKFSVQMLVVICNISLTIFLKYKLLQSGKLVTFVLLLKVYQTERDHCTEAHLWLRTKWLTTNLHCSHDNEYQKISAFKLGG